MDSIHKCRKMRKAFTYQYVLMALRIINGMAEERLYVDIWLGTSLVFVRYIYIVEYDENS